QVRHRDGLRNGHFAHDRLGRLLEAMLAIALSGAATTAATTLGTLGFLATATTTFLTIAAIVIIVTAAFLATLACGFLDGSTAHITATFLRWCRRLIGSSGLYCRQFRNGNFRLDIRCCCLGLSLGCFSCRLRFLSFTSSLISRTLGSFFCFLSFTTCLSFRHIANQLTR